MKNVLYVYGIVRDGFDAARAPAGLDDTVVSVVQSGGSAALVSRLGGDYAPESVESNSADVSWLSPRAMAHDRVLTWAQEHGGVIPFPMFSLWRSDDALAVTLAERAAEFRSVFARVSDADEFGVRVHRRDDVLLQSVDELDPEMRELKRQADAASPGQRYLLERKFADRSKQAAREAGQRMAKRVFDELSVLARESLARPLVPESGAARVPDATLVLNGAFLVDRRKLDGFRAAIGALVREYQPRGLTFDFTGPWPPYNFAGDKS